MQDTQRILMGVLTFRSELYQHSLDSTEQTVQNLEKLKRGIDLRKQPEPTPGPGHCTWKAAIVQRWAYMKKLATAGAKHNHSDLESLDTVTRNSSDNWQR